MKKLPFTILLFVTILSATSPLAQNNLSPESINNKADRLKSLILNYQKRLDQQTKSPSSRSPAPGEAPAINVENINWSKVLFDNREVNFLIARVNQSLANSTAESRGIDKIIHVKVVRDGKLLYNRARSLKNQGDSFYVGRLTLSSGRHTLSVDRKNWQLTIETADNKDYVAVYMRGKDQAPAELCLFPIAGITKTSDPLPTWLPLTEAERQFVVASEP